MSAEETHPGDGGHESGPERRIEEDAQRGPAHEAPDEVREDVGLGEEPRRGVPEGAPAPGHDGGDAPG